MTNKTDQTVLIVCDSSKSLIDFRGKLIEQIAKHHRVVVFTPTITQSHLRIELESLGATIHENSLQGSHVTIYSDIAFIIKLYFLIQRLKPDVFFPYTFKPVIYGAFIAKFCGVKKITPMLTGLGYNFTSTGAKNWVGWLTSRLLKLSLTTKPGLSVVFQNCDDCETLIKKKIISEKHQTFVVNGSGVDLDHYKYHTPKTKPISFLMVSRLINAKGIKEYHDAAIMIKQHYPNVQFQLIGAYDKNIDSISIDLYRQIKSDGVIQYLGEIDDVRPSIRDSSVVVLPSYYGEGIPRCLLEAMAMGRALITCDSVGCRETVTTKGAINGFLVPIRDTNSLVKKMTSYIHDKTLITTHGKNGLLMAREKFDVKIVNKQMMKIMQLD